MSNATGERTFSTTGRTVKEKTFPLIPPGNHVGTLGSDFEIAKKDAWDGVPYVKFSFAVAGTAQTDGGKDQRLYHQLYLSITPGKDGEINTERPDGVVAMAQAMKTEMEGVEIIEREVSNPENGETKKLEYLNPKQVVEWLKSFSGTEVSFRVKTEKGTNGYKDKNKLQKFLFAAE